MIEFYKEINGHKVFTNGKILFTNNHNLSEEVVTAMMMDRYTVEGEAPSDYSVSDVVAPTQKTILMKRNKDNLIIRDVMKGFKAFLGTMIHSVLEEGYRAASGAVIETRLYLTIHDRVISGKFDQYKKPKLRDYKTTGVYKLKKKDYTQWEEQLNCYAEFCEEHGYPVEEIEITAFALDWKAHETSQKDYPYNAIVTIPLEIWTKEKRKKYLDERVKRLVHAEAFTNEELSKEFPCSNRDMWKDLVNYQIIKDGSKRSTKNFGPDEKVEAEKYFFENYSNKPEYKLIEKWNKRTHCHDWCDVAHICSQHARLCKEEEAQVPVRLIEKAIF